jgi:hypothetical protein
MLLLVDLSNQWDLGFLLDLAVLSDLEYLEDLLVQ